MDPSLGPKGTKPTWHDRGVTDQQARYDRIAEGYAEWWSPIHRPATLGLLDEIAPALDAGATRILDIGCGTGALVAEVVARWPSARVTGVDISAGMLAIAARTVDALPDGAGDRVTLVGAPANRLPFTDGAFDVVVSAFVLQLVPSRPRALREARRVLVPDGSLATVGWMTGGVLGADAAYDDALVAAGLEPRGDGSAGDDPATLAEAAARLRRAGFARVRARDGAVEHAYTPEGYLAFVCRFDDEDLFATLDDGPRAALEADILARLRALPPEDLALWHPVVYATGRRSSRARGPRGAPPRGGCVGGRGPADRPVDQPSAAASSAAGASSAPSSVAATTSSTRGARTRAMTSASSAWIVTPSGTTMSATVIVAS